MALKFLIATNNKGKLREFNKILNSLDIECVSLKDMGIDIEIEETENSFLGNARLKAKEIYKIAKIPTISDDSGLLVEALLGEPGVYSARYAGDECDDNKNIEKLLLNMQKKENRKAKFKSVVYAVLDDDTEIFAEGECSGEILLEKIGSNGFGYDPVFYACEFGKSFAELSDEEKNGISHRGKAIKQLKEKLEEAFGKL
jgi:XTP/dITP diphosphohydrolase